MTRKPLQLAAFAVLAVAAVLFFVLGRSGSPTDSSAEAGFARDMGKHHAQAVEMSFIVRDRTTSPDIKNLSEDIIVTQTAQRGMFMGWLQQWGLNQASERPEMAWMVGHAGHGGTQDKPEPMPGVASDEELAKLRSLNGKQAEVYYLQLMIRHHEGGVDMSKGLLELTDRAEVRGLAQQIVNSQTSEIKLMADLLAKRGAVALPSILK
ncbi:DUF305 domain-containing protein [Nonomuraea africana]|uniref:Uncharacterized protein (DUF305 family) n=1 Tax=Nonomuraea africana TaxID=46171 RepID=A0ABR9KI71_9ACTN|nr:DUF305 domain-containing protein [Nonomuraea africana]MBE1561727.1 uncharacterized protein (DUF305 family) [Nonomuraea africana]